MFKNNIGMMVVLAIVVLGVMMGNSNATTISVKQLGCGAEANCYTTINNAISNASSNDTIKVYSGRYEEAVVIDKNLKLEGSGPQLTTIYSNTSNSITVNSNMNAVILGFTITSSKNGVGIYTGPTTNVTIRNNCVIGNGGSGVRMNTGTGSSGGIVAIINNVISYNAVAGIDCYSGNIGYAHNNIISNNGGTGIYFYYFDSSYRSYNNSYANKDGDYPSANTGDISVDPSFIDPFKGIYTLQSTSLCKNTGRPGSADADPDGSRNDMGAFGGPDAVAFWPYSQGTPIITNLTATPTSVQKGGTITIKATGAVQ